MYSVTRYHDISCGHRVVGHEGKCRFLHGHNYRIHFTVKPDTLNVALDSVGRVLDFSVIKVLLCEWLEENWDHKMLIWCDDEAAIQLLTAESVIEGEHLFKESLVMVPFNPTAENMAAYLVNEVAPKLLTGTGCRLTACRIDETRKCSAEYYT